MILSCNRLVLCVLTWCEKDDYSAFYIFFFEHAFFLFALFLKSNFCTPFAEYTSFSHQVRTHKTNLLRFNIKFFLFDKSRIYVELNKSSERSSFTRSELHLSTENQSWKNCWNQAENSSRRILLFLLGCLL